MNFPFTKVPTPMGTFVTLMQETVNPWTSNSTVKFLFYIYAPIASIIELWIIILWVPISAQLKIYVFYLYYYIRIWAAYRSHSFTCLVLVIIEGLCIFVMKLVVPLRIWKFCFWCTHAFGSVYKCVRTEWLGPEAVHSILRRLPLPSGHSDVRFHRRVSPRSSTSTSHFHFCDWGRTRTKRATVG